MAGGLSGYETPSFIYAAVLAFFLVMAILIERVAPLTTVQLPHDAYAGVGACGALLRQAWQKRTQSTPLASLLVSAVCLDGAQLYHQRGHDEICGSSVTLHGLRHQSVAVVNRFSHHDEWVAISSVEECNECLKDTRGLSSTYKEEHQCPFWQEEETDSPYAKEEAEGEHHRRLLGGEGGERVCDEGKEPLVSVAVLHEAHIAIFLLTVIHVFNVVIMVLMASYRLRKWRRWKQEDDKCFICVSDKTQSVTLEPLASTSEQGPSIKIEPGAEPDSTASESASGAAAKPESKTEEQNGISPCEDDSETVRTAGGFLKILHRAPTITTDNTCRKVVRTELEWVISFCKQFIRPVTQNEFRIMRAAFMLEHRRHPERFDFMEYLTNALDDDVAEVVKISTVGWITLIVSQVIWAPVSLAGWVLLACTVVFVCAVLIICTKLLLVVRHVTREGRINPLEPSVFWFSRPRLLLPVVRYTLFINSAIFAIMASLAIEYGPKSCIFAGNHGDGRGTYGSWILVLLLNTGSFLHISFIMLPTYSLVVHMGSSHWSHHLIKEDIKSKLMDWRNRAAQVESNHGNSERKTH